MSLKVFLQGGPTGLIKRRASPAGSTEGLLPITDIRHGLVITQDGRYVKILEVLPVNFYLKTPTEQHNIIHYFAAWLKIAPANIQMLSLTEKRNIDGFIAQMQARKAQEQSQLCRSLIEDIIEDTRNQADREAITHRFFIAFAYEPWMKLRGTSLNDIAERMNEEAMTATHYLQYCGLEVVQPRYMDNALCETLYRMLSKKTAQTVNLPESIFSAVGIVHGIPDDENEDTP